MKRVESEKLIALKVDPKSLNSFFFHEVLTDSGEVRRLKRRLFAGRNSMRSL
jgi:hypothetical protein